MAADNDILGISGQLNIEDIQRSINQLIDGLEKIGLKTDALSSRMTDAMNDIARSTDDSATKQKRAMDVLTQGLTEVKTALANYPDQLRLAKNEADQTAIATSRLETELGKLNTKFSDAVVGSKAYDDLSRSIASVKAQIHNNNALYERQVATIQEMEAGYNGLVSMLGLANTSATANAVAHNAVAASTLTETGAHAANAGAISQEGEAIDKENRSLKENADLTVQAAESAETLGFRSKEAANYVAELVERFHQLRESGADVTEVMKAQEVAMTAADYYGFDKKDYDLTLRSAVTDETKRNAEAVRDVSDAEKERAQAAEQSAQKSVDANTKSKRSVEEIEAELRNLRDSYNQYFGSNRLSQFFGKWEFSSFAEDGLVPQETLDRIMQARERMRQLKEELKEAKEEARQTGENLNGSSTGSTSTENVTSVNERLKEQREIIIEARDAVAQYEAEINKLGDKKNLTASQQREYEELCDKVRKAKQEIENANAAIRDIRGETTIGTIRNAFGSLGDKVSEVAAKMRDWIAQHTGLDKVGQKIDEVNDKMGNSSFIQRFTAEANQAKEAVNDFGAKIGDILTGNGKFQASLGQMGSALGALGAPLKAATGGVVAMTKALWSMAATPIGAVIAAVVLGLQALFAWFNKSAEGQRAYAKISAYVGSLMTSLLDIVVRLGGYLYHAFADANGPMNAFGRGLVTTFKSAITATVKLVEGLGNTIKGIFTWDWDTFKNGLKSVKDGLVSSAETIKNAFTTVWDGWKGAFKMASDGLNTLDTTDLMKSISTMHESAKQASRLAEEELNAQKRLGEEKVKARKLDIEIAKEREKIYTLTGKEKDAQIELVKNLLKQRYDGQIEAQQKLLDIQKQRSRLHTMSLEDYAKEREMQGSVYAIEAQRAASTRMLVRMQQSNLKSMGNDNKKDKRLQQQINEADARSDETVIKNALQRQKAERELELRLVDARIAAMREGSEKVLAERERGFQKELEQLDEQRREAIEAERARQKAEFEAQEKAVEVRGGTPKQWNDEEFDQSGFVQKINEQYEELVRLAGKKMQEDSADEFIKAHQSYTDKKKEIDRNYLDTVTAINKAITEAEARGDTERVEALRRSRIEAAKQRAEQQSQLSLDELKKTPEYVRAFEDLGKTSSETLDFLIGEFERAKRAAAESLDPEHLREYTSALQQMYDELNSRNPFKTFAQSARELKAAQNEVETAQKNLDFFNTYGKLVKRFTTGQDGKPQAEYYTQEELQKKLAAAKDKEAQASNRLLKAVTSCAQQIQSLGSMLEDLGNKIGGSFGGALGAVGGIGDSLGSVISNLQNLNTKATGFSAVLQKVSAVGTAISAMIDMNMKLDSLLPDSYSLYEHYAAKQREINKMQQDIMELQIAQLEDRLNQEHWIYSNGLTNLRKSAELNEEYLAAYGKIALQPQEIYQNAGSGFSKWAPAIFGAIVGIIAGVLTFGSGAGIGATLGAAIGSAIGGTAIGAALGATTIALIGTAIFSGVGSALANAVRAGIDGLTYDSDQTAAINNMRVQTRHKTYFRSEKTQDLESWVRENWGEELFEDVKGVKLIDPEVARKILEDGPTLVGETRETLEQLTEYSEKIHEFLDDVHEQVSEAFSPLVDNLTDALWDWLAEGKDVMDQFREYSADTFKEIAQDAIKAMANRLIFEPFQEQLENLTIAYGTGQIDETAYTLGVAAFATQAQEAIAKNLPALQNAIEVIQMAMENAGIDITGGTNASDQSATYNSLEKWSYDQADDLINRATALQIIDEHQYEILTQGLEVAYSTLQSVESIRINVGEILTAIQTTIELQDIANSKLDRIIANTLPIAEIRDYVKKLYNER